MRLIDADALRESVLKWLPPDPCGVEEKEHPYETDICVSMLMEIEDAPTIELDSDTISRQAVIDAIMIAPQDWDGMFIQDLNVRIREKIEALPSAQPEQKRGRWEMKPDPYGFFDEIPVCSECGCTTKMRETYKFCPNCGADNREGVVDSNKLN